MAGIMENYKKQEFLRASIKQQSTRQSLWPKMSSEMIEARRNMNNRALEISNMLRHKREVEK